jgi:uncharacterized protein YbcI
MEEPRPGAAQPQASGPRPLVPFAPPPMDGALRAAISQAVVRLHAEHYGKGATQAKTYVWDNVVVIVLRDVLTAAERTLVSVDRADAVRQVRSAFQLSLEATFRSTIERLTGRRVESFMSQVDPDHGMGVEVFVLEPLDGTGYDDRPAAA